MINRYASLRQGLVGCWVPSLGASGYRLIDRSGNNNHGTLTNMDPGTDWVPSGGKLALDFDGSNDYVSIASIAPALGFSFSAWFKAGATTKARHSIFTNADDSGPDIYLHLENVTGSVYQMNFYNGTAYLGPSSTFTLDFNFHHYCWTTDQQGGASYWADGVYLGKASSSWTPINRNKQASLGAIPVLIGSAFTAWGTLDDCRRYNRTLTHSEIRLLYTGGRGVGLMPERIKHRRKTSAAATNRRRRILIGASQ